MGDGLANHVYFSVCVNGTTVTVSLPYSSDFRAATPTGSSQLDITEVEDEVDCIVPLWILLLDLLFYPPRPKLLEEIQHFVPDIHPHIPQSQSDRICDNPWRVSLPV